LQPLEMEPAMLQSRGAPGEFTSSSLRREARSDKDRLTMRLALLAIGGISLFLWIIILEVIAAFRA